MIKRLSLLLALIPLLFIGASPASAKDRSLRISVPDQRLYVFEGDQIVSSYRVSTSQFGLGDARGSYATPLGWLEVCGKIGQGAQPGTVFKGGRKTGEIIKVNARDRDPIVTRILRLRGLEKHNSSAASRGIYIHGTPEERKIGRRASYGCVRMKSKDVIELFDAISVGTKVEITTERISPARIAQRQGKDPGAS